MSFEFETSATNNLDIKDYIRIREECIYTSRAIKYGAIVVKINGGNRQPRAEVEDLKGWIARS